MVVRNNTARQGDPMGVMSLGCCDFQNPHRFFPTGRIAFFFVKGIKLAQDPHCEIRDRVLSSGTQGDLDLTKLMPTRVQRLDQSPQAMADRYAEAKNDHVAQCLV